MGRKIIDRRRKEFFSWILMVSFGGWRLRWHFSLLSYLSPASRPHEARADGIANGFAKKSHFAPAKTSLYLSQPFCGYHLPSLVSPLMRWNYNHSAVNKESIVVMTNHKNFVLPLSGPSSDSLYSFPPLSAFRFANFQLLPLSIFWNFRLSFGNI